MTISRFALGLYTQSLKTRADRRLGAKHDRYFRSFIRKQYGSHEIIFYPLKEWVSVVGVNNQTLRTWIQKRVISAFKMHRMYVMCLAEQHALARVVQRHHMMTKHGEITDAFRAEAFTALQEVRLALDTLASPKHTLTEQQYMLLAPSITGGG